MKNDKKIIVIGIDGATFKILDKLDKKGKTPYLSSLRKQAYGVLESTIPSISATAWATFQTGVNPAKHGVYDFFYYKNNKREVINAKDIKFEKIYEYFGKEGYKSLLVNFPISYPVRPIDGTIISSFLTPKKSNFAYPLEVQQKLKEDGYVVDLFLGGDDAFAPDKDFSETEKKKILKELVNIAEKRFESFKKLYAEDDYKLSFIYFKGTDIIQHLDFDGKYTEKYYEKLDKLLLDLDKFISDKSKQEIYTFFISDHGFHTIPETEFYVYKWFKENFPDTSSNQTKSEKTWSLLHAAHNMLKKFGINFTRYKIVNNYKKRLINNANQFDDSLTGRKIRIDAKGIYLGQDYSEDDKESIRTSLKILKYNDQNVFKIVDFRENIYEGQYLENAPDIVWLTNEKFVVNPAKTAVKVFQKNNSHLKGEHYSDREGIYFAKGKGIKKINKKYSIQDLLPTILYLSEIDISEKIDGNIMSEIFNKKYFKNKLSKISEYNRYKKLIDVQYLKIKNEN